MKKFSLIFVVAFLSASAAQAIHHPSPTAIAAAKTIDKKKGTVQKPQPTGEKVEQKISEKKGEPMPATVPSAPSKQ